MALATKTVSFKSPYTGATFQRLTELIYGRDGYLSGGGCADELGEITLQPFVFVQRGIICETGGVDITIPAELLDGTDLIEPAWVIAGTPDDNPASEVAVTVTGSLALATNSVVIAFKAGGAWQNPVPVDLTGPAMRASESGLEDGANGRATVVASGAPPIPYVTGLDVERGQVVDPDGVRRRLAAGAASTAEAFNLTPTSPDPLWDRTDHIVRRQVDANLSEIVHLQGSLHGEEGLAVLQTTSGVCRPHYYGKRGGGYNDQWWAWASGGPPSNLRIIGGPAGDGFAATTLLVGGGTISQVWIVGQRVSDDAIILIYIDNGNELKMVSFDAAAGTVIDAAVTLNSDVGVKTQLRAARANGETFSVVYRRQEGGNGEIYYGKFSYAVTSFGTAAVAPNYIEGAAEGSISLWPDVAHDRYGRAHVCWVNGVTGIDGDLKYQVRDANGDIEIATVTYAPSVHVGTTDDSVLLDPDAGAGGFVAEAFDAFTNCHITVTPHDEVYIALLGESTASSPVVDQLLLFHPDFQRAIGFPIVSVATTAGLLEASYTANLGSLNSCDIVAGELGQLHIGLISSHAAPRHHLFTLNPQPFRNGFFEKRSLPYGANIVTTGSLGTFDDYGIELGMAGDVVLLSRTGAGGAMNACSQRQGGLRPTAPLYSGSWNSLQVEYHPKDLPLLQYEVGADTDRDAAPFASNGPLAEDGIFAVQHVRPKKMNYPFLVGDRGDYQGFGSLRRALAEAQRLGGGDVVVRAGYHKIHTTAGTDYFTVGGGVSLRGEPNAYLEFPSSVGLVSSGSNRVVIGHAVSGNIVTLAKAELLGAGIGYVPRVGDIIDLADGGSGFHTIRAILAPVGTDVRYLLENNENGAPALGAATYAYAAGVKIENLTIRAALSGATHFHLLCAGLYQPSIRNLRIEGSMTAAATGAAVDLNACHQPVIENIDLRGLAADAAAYAFRVRGSGEHSRDGNGCFRGIRLVDGKGRVRVTAEAQTPVFIDCGGDGSNGAAVVWDIEAGRSTPVYLANCTGRVTGDTAFLATTVGKTLRVPADADALAFEDDNTRGAGITDDAIKLSAAAPNDKFNGATEDVITTAVNERVLKAGDTMEGPLELRSSSYFATLGLQTMIDRGGQLAHLGEYFYDDFHDNPVDADNTVWEHTSDAAGGVTTWLAPHRAQLDSGGGAGGTAQMTTVQGVAGPWTGKPLFRARAAFTTAAAALNAYTIGLRRPSDGTLIAFFAQSTASYGDAVLRFSLCNVTPAYAVVSTGFTPTVGVMYWFWIAWKSATEASWAISTDLTSAPVASGDLQTTGALAVLSGDLGPTGRSFEGGLDTAVLVWDVVEIATTTRKA